MSPISFGSYGEIGKPIMVFEGYRDWNVSPEAQEVREAGSTSDFAIYLDTIIRRVFFERYERAESLWRRFARTMSVSDYREVSSVSLTGMPLLRKVNEGGEYKDTPIGEIEGPKIKVEKFGNLFSLTREIFINDDLNRLNEIPQMMAEAARTSLDLNVINVLENPGVAYDGIAFFHTNHGNLLTTEPLSEAALAKAVTLMRKQTGEDGYRINIRPSFLVIPVDLQFTAARVLNSTEIHIQGEVANPFYGQGNYNYVKGIVDYIVEPYLTDSNDYYLFSDPGVGRPAMQVAFLNGMERPFIGLKNPEVRGVLGSGGDPYTMLYDEIWWKVRHEWGIRMWEWRSVVKVSNA